MKTTLGKARKSPTGLTQWPVLEDGVVTAMSLIWLGRGAGLLLGINANSVEGTVTTIEQDEQRGPFETTRDARKAAEAFLR